MKKNSMTRRGFLAGTAATGALAALALSGCGGGGEDEPAGEGGEGAAEPTLLSVARAYSSTSYSPIDLNGGSALMMAATFHVFDGLYNLDLTDYSVYPGLADGEPVKVSETQYEVALRAGAKFSNGADVTVDDVINAFNVNMSPETAGTCSPFLSFIDSVEAGEGKVIFNLKYPYESGLKGRLALVKIFPAAEQANLATMPIGSGPWAYKTINGDDGGLIEFVPNANYAGETPATADAMNWLPMKSDAIARVTALQEGSVQIADEIPAANAAQLTNAGAAVEYVQGFKQPFFMFNCKKAPFNDKRVRQAFFYAIDVEKLIANQMDGYATPLTSFLYEGHPNYNKAATVYTYDPEKAKGLLKEAGVAEGFAVEMYCNNNWVADLSAQIKNDLDAIGLNVTIREEAIDWASLAESDAELPYDFMLTPGDPGCFGNDPDLWMSWWYADNVWTQGRSCWKHAGDGKWEEFQGLLQAARQATGAEQQGLWNQCYDMLAEEVPLYALFHCMQSTGYRPDLVENFVPIGTNTTVVLGATPIA